MTLIIATVLTAECKEYWQLLLCQGLLTGFACGMTLCPILAIVAQWFKKRRSLAFGIVSAGASLGGTLIPIVARNLIDLIGYVSASSLWRTWLIDFFRFKWTMRVIALIELFMLAIANLVKIFTPSPANIGLTALPLDSQTKARSSSEDLPLLLSARFQETCVQYLHLLLHS